MEKIGIQNFITFEGIEGCGKSTHSKLISEFLNQSGFPVMLTREPGGTKISELIRDILLNDDNSEMSVMCELFLYTASRAQLIEEIIKPALNSGKIIICDRFVDATVCYQGYAGGIDLKLIQQVSDVAVNGIVPGLTVFLDADPDKAVSSIENPDRMEKKNMQFHHKVSRGYNKLAEKFPERIKKVTIKKSIEETQKEIKHIIMSYLNRK